MSTIKAGPVLSDITCRVEIAFDADERPATRGDRLPSTRGDIREREARIVSASLLFQWSAEREAWVYSQFQSSFLIENRNVDGTWQEPKKARGLYPTDLPFLDMARPGALTTVTIE